jgi:hypothetical protein
MTGIGSGVAQPHVSVFFLRPIHVCTDITVCRVWLLQTLLEHTFTMVVLLVGLTMYATLVGNLSHIIQNMHSKVQV